eukprot:ANDGO_01296.mRNA.1 Uroporphyrinogen decarboxylase
MVVTNSLIVEVLSGAPSPSGRVPVWLMRQAGRYLPEFRQLRAEAEFFKVCRTPKLACEVTMQPLLRFPLDAAIIFSDILVIPQAMGVDVQMVPGKGPVLSPTLDCPASVSAVLKDPCAISVEGDLGYVFRAIEETVAVCDRPVLGFTGAPWTLFAYMVEGSGSKTFAKAKKFLYEYEPEALQVLQRITDCVVPYVVGQVRAGASAIQVFDSWANELSVDAFMRFSYPFLKQIAQRVKEQCPGTPLIVFAKGANHAIGKLAHDTLYDVIGVDWTIDLGEARKLVGEHKLLQGNMDPCVLYASADVIRKEVRRILVSHGTHRGLIFNLGHGMHPEHNPEHVAILVDAVHTISEELYGPSISQ